MAAVTLTLSVRINRPRLRAIFQEAIGELRRARRGDRPAIADRAARDAVRLCVRVVGKNGGRVIKPPHTFGPFPSAGGTLRGAQIPT